MFDRKKDKEGARPAPEAVPDDDEPESAPTPITPEPLTSALPGTPEIPRRSTGPPRTVPSRVRRTHA